MLTIRSDRGHGAWKAVILVNTAILALLVLLALVYQYTRFGLSRETTILLEASLLLGLFVWSLWSWRVSTGGLFDPYALFLIAAVLFNGGQAFLEILDLNEIGILGGKFPAETIIETLYLVMLGFAAFHTGGLLSVLERKRSVNDREDKEKNTAATLQALRLVGWALIAISLVPAFLILRDTAAFVSSHGYYKYLSEDVTLNSSAAIRILANFIVPGSLFLLAGSRAFRFNVLLAEIVILAYSSALFFIGFRQGAAMIILANAWVYHRCIRPLPKAVLLGAGAIMLFVVFPMISLLREVTGGKRISLSALPETFASIENPAVDAVSEMGSSMATVAYTISLVPGYRDLDLGVSYLYALFDIFPNLFWKVHPTIAHGTLDDWLVQTVMPLSATGQWSLGYSFIAEAYLNFGWFGAPLALGVLGFLLGKFVLWSYRPADFAKIAVVGAFTGFFLVYARGEFHDIVRPLVWYALFPYLGVCGLKLLIRPRIYRRSGRYRGFRRSEYRSNPLAQTEQS